MAHDPRVADRLLSRLIAFDTVSSRSNAALVDFLCELLDRPGVSFERLASVDGKSNLLVRIGPTRDDRRGLTLSGHLDVVPADEPDWSHDPFAMQTTDERHSGRGTADMKGFIALAAATAASLDPATLEAPLALLLTRDEEVGTLGARDLVREWGDRRPLPRATVIGEPTSLRAVRLHKGHARFRLELRGKSAHSGYPHLGDNAIELAGRAIAALTALREELCAERAPTSEHFPEVPFVPLNLGTITGGAAINVVPEACQLEFGLRALPGIDTEELFERVHARLAEALPAERHRCTLLDESPPLALDEDAPVYRQLCALLGQHATHSVAYATDGGWLSQLDLDCLIWGPGSIEVAHRPNEFVPRADLARAAGLLDRLVADHCLGE